MACIVVQSMPCNVASLSRSYVYQSYLARANYCHHTGSHVCLIPVSIWDIGRTADGQASVACLDSPKLLAIMQYPLGRHLGSMVEYIRVVTIRMPVVGVSCLPVSTK